MKRADAGMTSRSSYHSAENENVVSHMQAAESLHEISVNTPTLRDQFAMSALQGLLANHQCAPMGMSFEPDYLSRRAYRLADAMLEARK